MIRMVSPAAYRPLYKDAHRQYDSGGVAFFMVPVAAALPRVDPIKARNDIEPDAVFFPIALAFQDIPFVFHANIVYL